MSKEYTLELGSERMTFKTGLLATQANASVICQYGDTVSMSNCTVSAKARAGVDFLPLQVVYQEKYYAGGKIAGSRFRKREGRPGDDYVLEHDVVSANATNLAVALSDCPFEGPLGSVRVGLIGGELVLNPSREAALKSDLDMFVTASLERVVMIEAGAKQVPEAEIHRAIEFGKKWAQKIAHFFADIQKEVGKAKFIVEPPFEHKEAYEFLKSWALPEITKAIKSPMPKLERRAIFNALMEQAGPKLREKFGESNGRVSGAMMDVAKLAGARAREQFGVEAGMDIDMDTLYGHASHFIDKIIKGEMRRLILDEGVRMSGRKVDERSEE